VNERFGQIYDRLAKEIRATDEARAWFSAVVAPLIFYIYRNHEMSCPIAPRVGAVPMTNDQ
jgi:hypothetical protein